MSEIIIEEIDYFLENIITICLMINLLQPRHKVKYSVMGWTAITFVFTVLTFSFKDVTMISGPIKTLGEVLSIALLFKDKWYKKLLIYVERSAMLFFGEIFALCCYRVFTGTWQAEYNTIEFQLGSVMYVLFYSFICPIAIALNKKTNIKKLLWILASHFILTFSQISFVFVIYFANKNLSSNQLLILVTSAIIPSVFVNLFFMQVIETSTKIAVKQKELSFAQERTEQKYSYYKLALENERKLSALRHDMANTLQVTQALVEKGNYTQGKKIIEEFSKEQSKIKPIEYCDKEIINTIIALKSTQNNNENINLNVCIKNSLLLIPLSEMEVTNVLTNLIDNCFEACEKANELCNIELTIAFNQGYLVFKTINPYFDNVKKDELKNSPKTTKKDKVNHGYGLKIIEEICKKHQGNLSVIFDNNICKTTATFFREHPKTSVNLQ